MKFKSVFISAPFELNRDIPMHFPYLTFKGKDGVMVNVVHDTSTIKGFEKEMKDIKAMLNADCNKEGLALKDVEFRLKWVS